MKISHLRIKGFLGIDGLDLKLDGTLALIVGANASGKTSILHGLMFVLTDQLCRVAHKKDVKRLIRDGHKTGSVEITVDGVTYQRSAVTGHIISKEIPPEPSPALRFCLDPGAIIALTQQERRSFLYRLMNINMKASSIVDMLIKRGHPEALVTEIAALLRAAD